MENGDNTDNSSHKTKHRCDTGDNSQNTNVFFKFRYFQLANIFDRTFDIFNRAANAKQPFLKHAAKRCIAVPADSYS